MTLFNKNYLKLLEQEIQNEKPTVPDEGTVPNDGSIRQKNSLIHYAPKDMIVSIKKTGLCCKRILSKVPGMNEKFAERYAPYIAEKLSIAQDKVTPETVLHFLDMVHPGLNKSINAFFCRIPEGIPHLQEFLDTHVPIRIVLKKLMSAKENGFKIYGRNFPTSRNWIKLKTDHIDTLSDQRKDWYGYFAKEDATNHFTEVPSAAIVPSTGIIPSFALKVLSGNDEY